MIRVLLVLALLLPAAAEAATMSAADPRGAEAGAAILRAGGSAADAAMATMLALTVVEPQSSGIGGGGFLVHHDGRTGTIATVDGRETAPADATPDRFRGADGTLIPWTDRVPGGLSVGVPGNIRLMARTHARWGRLPWAKLFEPAIRLAEQGFTVTPRLAAALAGKEALWADFPAARAIWWHNGRPLRAGERATNPPLAVFLRRVAAEGPEAFYAGQNAAAIRDALANSTRNPATMTLADLSGYEAKDRPALCGAYRGYRICGMGPPSAGPETILAILGLVERFDLPAMGPRSATSWHLLGEAMRLAYADRDRYMADTDFTAVPLAGLIDPGYLRSRSALIQPTATLGRYEPGVPPGAEPRGPARSGEVAGTTHFVAVDDAGNIATMTSTVESGFGSSLVVNGYFLNNELTDFSAAASTDNGAPVANRVEGGKRPLSSMSPIIVYDPAGKPVLALGSAGGRQIPIHVLRVIVGFIDWRLPAKEALALPNLFFNGAGLVVEQGTFLDELRPDLARLGETVVAAGITSKVNAAERTASGWRGAADPRSEGVAIDR